MIRKEDLFGRMIYGLRYIIQHQPNREERRKAQKDKRKRGK